MKETCSFLLVRIKSNGELLYFSEEDLITFLQITPDKLLITN